MAASPLHDLPTAGPPLAAFDLKPLFEDTGITLALMGLLVVFAALLLVRVFIGLLPRMLGAVEQYVPEKAPAAAPEPAAEEPGLPDELLAVIAAVVAHTVRKPHRIVRTRDLTPDDKSWSMEGRLQHHASHRIQTRGQGRS
ncbi:MAG: OadG family transporter subunit [Planctomycetota bacterium]